MSVTPTVDSRNRGQSKSDSGPDRLTGHQRRAFGFSTRQVNDGPSNGEEYHLNKNQRRFLAYFRMAVISAVLALFIWILIATLLPTVVPGQAHGQPVPGGGLFGGPIPADCAEQDIAPNANATAPLEWTVSANPGDPAQTPGHPVTLSIGGIYDQPLEFEVMHGGPLEFRPYGKKEKAAHLIDFFRKPEVALDQIELKFYDLDRLTNTGYRNLVQQIESAETSAFALQDDEGAGSAPFIVLAIPWSETPPSAGPAPWDASTTYLGTTILWNETVDQLLNYSSTNWSLQDIARDSTDREKRQYTKCAMYALLTEANAAADAYVRQLGAVDNDTVYIGVPAQLMQVGRNAVEAFSSKSHLRAGLYGSEERAQGSRQSNQG